MGFLFGGGGGSEPTIPSLMYKAIAFGDASGLLSSDITKLSIDPTGGLTSGYVFRVGAGVMQYWDYTTGTNAEFLAYYNVSGTYNFESRSAGAGTTRPVRWKVGDSQFYMRLHSGSTSHFDFDNNLGNGALTNTDEGFVRVRFSSSASSGVSNCAIIDGTSTCTGSAKFNTLKLKFNDSTTLTADQNILSLWGGATVFHSFSGLDSNIAFHRNGGSEYFGGGTRVMFIGNCGTAPSTNPTGGVILYSESGALKYRDPSGTTTTIGSGGSTVKDFEVFKPADNEQPSSNGATIYYRGDGRPILLFDSATQEAAQFSSAAPRYYAGGNLIVDLTWAAVATSGNIGWDVTFEKLVIGTDDTDSTSWATAQTVTATSVPATSGVLKQSSVTITAGAAGTDSIAAGDFYRLRVRRDVSVSGNATGDAQLFLVQIREA